MTTVLATKALASVTRGGRIGSIQLPLLSSCRFLSVTSSALFSSSSSLVSRRPTILPSRVVPDCYDHAWKKGLLLSSSLSCCNSFPSSTCWFSTLVPATGGGKQPEKGGGNQVEDDVASSSSWMDHPGNTFTEEDISRMFLHHGRRPRYRKSKHEKFKIPKKRASSLLHFLTKQSVHRSKANKPNVFDVPFRVGDAIELEVIESGGINATRKQKVRGIVIGIFNKHMDTSVLIRDVIHRIPVERKIKLHSPLVQSLKVLEENFIYKGKRRVKRAKLYFLRNRNDSESRVTKKK